MRRIIRLAAGALVCGLVACGEALDGDADGGSWVLHETVRIGARDGAGPSVLSEPAALEVDARGRIYVLLPDEGEVRVFDSAGAFVRRFGASGAGPGELRAPIGLTRDLGGRIWIVDPGNARYSVYDSAGRYLGDHPRRIAGYVVPWIGGFAPDGRLWDSFNQYVPGAPEVVGLVGLDQDLAPRDTLIVGAVEEEYFEVRPGFREHVPFTPWLALALDPAGAYWVGDAAAYEMVKISLAGDTLQRIERDYDPVPVTAAERDSAWARLRPYREAGGTVDASRFPDVKPAFDVIVPDDQGRLWVHLRTPDDEARPPTETIFDLFGADGIWLGRVRLPLRLELFRPRPRPGDRVVAVARDELDVPYVVVLEPDRSLP